MSSKPAYLMEPSEHGPYAQWRAADGQQMNVFHHPGYERLADSHVVWSTDTATGSLDFDSVGEAVQFAVQKNKELGLPEGDHFVPPTDEEQARWAEAQKRRIAHILKWVETPKAVKEGYSDTEKARLVVVPDHALGPWYLTATTAHTDNGDCVLCGGKIRYQRQFFHLIGGEGEWDSAKAHVKCGSAVSKAASPGIDLIWFPNG